MFNTSQKIRRFLTHILSLVLLTSLIVVTPTPKKVSASQAELQQGQFVVPFLYPPYPGAVTENSIFDHHLPTYETTDFTILSYTGHEATGSCTDKVCYSESLNRYLSYDGHPGIDYGADYLPVFASADADQVLSAGWDSPTDHRAGLGLYVRLHHPNNYETYYGHLSTISVSSCTFAGCVNIAHGEVIGISGNTGSSSGPHLHFEVHNPDPSKIESRRVIDPYGWNPNRSDLPPSDTQNDLWTDTWRSNPNQSLWLDYPEISNTNSVLYALNEGNPLTYPLFPGSSNSTLIDDYGHILAANNGQLPPGSSPSFTADACWTIPNEDPLTSIDPAYYAINQYKLRALTNAAECSATWSLPADQPSGNYAIYVHLPGTTNNPVANSVPYRIYADGDEVAKVLVNQGEIESYLESQASSPDFTTNAAWLYVGSYFFVQGEDNYISVSNIPEETIQAGGIVIADAVKFLSVDSGNIDIALIIDSSGSMGSNDPGNKRLQASRFFVTSAAIQGDYVGIVDFDSSVRVATNPPLQKLHENNTSVIAAINTINSSGGTNIGNGVQSGCDILNLSDRSDYKKGAILLTDGVGSFSNQDQCFKSKGWPIFTFGFGQANDTQLQQIAFNTGGRYKRVSNLNSLTCEFIRVRSLIANVEPPPCLPYNVPQLASIFFSQTVAPGQAQATFSTGWPGSDVVMTLTSPSGRVIDRNTVAPDVIHENGSTYEVYTIANPEAGIWQVNLYGANVPAAGEEVIFGFASVPALEGGFPSTPVLDDYNRANGAIGGNWTGNPSKYAIASNQLLVTSNDSNSDIYFSGQAFGADQEAYITFANIHATAAEQDLILKAQSSTTWGSGMIEVLYDAPNQRVQVWTWEWPAGWAQHGADIPVTFVNGDTFGARALANGNVEVYKNGELLGVRDVTSWSYYDQGGYIGLWFVGANGARLDDFGGGTLPSGMQALMADAPASTSQTGMTAAQRNVKTNSASPFWQGIPLKTNQIASVTFANLQASVKPQSNGIWGENTVQVLYDVPNQRIQVWRYDPAKGWTQIGKDIPTKFTAGDVFTVRVLSGGTLEISRNGKLLAKRKASP